MYLQLQCDICREVIGKFDPETLSMPLNGRMFEPKTHQYPHPFPPVDWIEMRCPICRKRPFIYQERVMTPNGYYEIGSSIYPGEETRPVQAIYTETELEQEWIEREDELRKYFICEQCGKSFVTEHGKNLHITRYCKGEAA